MVINTATYDIESGNVTFNVRNAESIECLLHMWHRMLAAPCPNYPTDRERKDQYGVFCKGTLLCARCTLASVDDKDNTLADIVWFQNDSIIS